MRCLPRWGGSSGGMTADVGTNDASTVDTTDTNTTDMNTTVGPIAECGNDEVEDGEECDVQIPSGNLLPPDERAIADRGQAAGNVVVVVHDDLHHPRRLEPLMLGGGHGLASGRVLERVHVQLVHGADDRRHCSVAGHAGRRYTRQLGGRKLAPDLDLASGMRWSAVRAAERPTDPCDCRASGADVERLTAAAPTR